MPAATKDETPKILILASLSGGYRGADATGQSHLGYAPNTYILPIMSAAMFPESFYLKAFERGFDGILVMYSGTDSPYKGEIERTAEIIGRTYDLMKERNLDPRRLKLTSICTVCVQPFLKEVNSMNHLLAGIGPLPREQQPEATREGAR
ncbi:MAG: hydrogenase iron-sulfur subunit [Chloroflexi bacterium]|nr:hydrogenase iron-sulfur subunit [Chloroflexota bacterium]